jgi:hypothetical protein
VVHTSKEKAGEWDLVLKETSAVNNREYFQLI